MNHYITFGHKDFRGIIKEYEQAKIIDETRQRIDGGEESKALKAFEAFILSGLVVTDLHGPNIYAMKLHEDMIEILIVQLQPVQSGGEWILKETVSKSIAQVRISTKEVLRANGAYTEQFTL